MESQKCPLDGNWGKEFCSCYSKLKNTNTIHECEHQDGCSDLRKKLEDRDTKTVEAVFQIGIPNMLIKQEEK